MALLIDLDRIDAAISALVVVFANSAVEDGVHAGHAVLEDVGEAHQQGRLNVALAQLIDKLLEVDLHGRILGRMDCDMPFGVDGEILLSPLAHAIERFGVADCPALGNLGLNERLAVLPGDLRMRRRRWRRFLCVQRHVCVSPFRTSIV